MSKYVPSEKAADPLALRLSALAALMDHVIASLRKRTEQLREFRDAVELSRENDTGIGDNRISGVQSRDLEE